MSFESAFAAHEFLHREAVMRNTWGHLAPEPHHKYQGTILVARGYRDEIILDYEFEISGGPWLYYDMLDFLDGITFAENGVYRWQGWYKKFKNDNYQFGGGKWELVFKAQDAMSR